MSNLHRFMVGKNNKIIGYKETKNEAFDLIRVDFNKKKQDIYKMFDIELSENICCKDYVYELQQKANQDKKTKPKKKVKRNQVIDTGYSKWLGTQACVISGVIAKRGVGLYDTQCHHIDGRARGERNDQKQVPLAGHVHMFYHSHTKDEFCLFFGLPFDGECLKQFFHDCSNKLRSKYKKECPDA